MFKVTQYVEIEVKIEYKLKIANELKNDWFMYLS